MLTKYQFREKMGSRVRRHPALEFLWANSKRIKFSNEGINRKLNKLLAIPCSSPTPECSNKMHSPSLLSEMAWNSSGTGINAGSSTKAGQAERPVDAPTTPLRPHNEKCVFLVNMQMQKMHLRDVKNRTEGVGGGACRASLRRWVTTRR